MYPFVRFSLILSVSYLITVTGCVTKPETGPFAIRVRGTVVDSLAGFPLAGAQILMWDNPDWIWSERLPILHEVVVTDSTGSYSFEIPIADRSDSFPIGISASKQEYNWKFFYVEWSSGIQTFNFRLVPDM